MAQPDLAAVCGFLTAFLGRYESNAVIVALYSATLTVISLAYEILSWHALTHYRLIALSVDKRTIRYEHVRGLLTSPFFVLSIGIAFLNPELAKFCWLAPLILRPLVLPRLQTAASAEESSE